MKSTDSLLSPPPSPFPAPFPLSTSPLAHCPELDLSITLSPAPKTGRTHLKSHPLRITQQPSCSKPKSNPKRQTEGKGNSKVRFEEPPVIKVIPKPIIEVKETLPQLPIRGQRRGRGRHHVLQQHVEPPATPANQDPSSLETAELNTTLALKAELQSLQGAEFNSQKAVQETLQRSERTKYLINTRATEEVNVSRSQVLFTSLVSVDVREDLLISEALQDRLQLAPPLSLGNKAEEGPSLSFFMTSDLCRQKPLPLEEEQVICKPRLQTRPKCSTFDLYKRRTRFEA